MRLVHERASREALAEELNKMRKAGKVVAEMHEATRAAIRPGVTTMQLNEVAAEVLAKRGPFELLELPRLPGRDLHQSQRHDRARHSGDITLHEGDIISSTAEHHRGLSR